MVAWLVARPLGMQTDPRSTPDCPAHSFVKIRSLKYFYDHSSADSRRAFVI